MTRKVAVIGNETFPLNVEIGTQVVDVLKSYGEDVVFLTRNAQGFEQFVATAALALGRRCFTYPGRGSGDNLARDAELVADADEVVAFLNPATLDNPRSGAALVLDRALAAGKPVRAATTVHGMLVWA